MTPNDYQSMLWTLLALGILVGSFALLRHKTALSGEISRKAVHMGMGSITVFFPWMFESSWPVWLLALLACGLIGAMNLIPPLKMVFRGVERKTYGEIYFPLAVAFVFHYSKGAPVIYCPPILMLTFGDAFAALIGKRFGVSYYTTHEGRKSWEGSAAFIIASFTTTSVCLLVLSDYAVGKIVLIALLVSIVGFITEGFAWKGLDNLFIPVFGMFAMAAFHALTVADLLIRLVAICGLLAICFALKNRSTMNGSALLGSALILYLVWALAGWQWALSPLLVFLLFTRVVTFDYRMYQDYQSVNAVILINIVPLFWLAQAIRSVEPEVYFWPFTLSLAIHLSSIWSKRAKTQGRKNPLLLGATAFPFIALGAAQLIPLLALVWFGNMLIDAVALGMSLATCSSMSALSVIVGRYDKQPVLSIEEWSFRNGLSLTGSLAAYWAAVHF